MTYTKPEIAVLGDADRVIQGNGHTKPYPQLLDGTVITKPQPAYDLDE
jgi:hypothetical protein